MGGNTLLYGEGFSTFSDTKLGPFARKKQLKLGSLLTGY